VLIKHNDNSSRCCCLEDLVEHLNTGQTCKGRIDLSVDVRGIPLGWVQRNIESKRDSKPIEPVALQEIKD